MQMWGGALALARGHPKATECSFAYVAMKLQNQLRGRIASYFPLVGKMYTNIFFLSFMVHLFEAKGEAGGGGNSGGK